MSDDDNNQTNITIDQFSW